MPENQKLSTFQSLLKISIVLGCLVTFLIFILIPMTHLMHDYEKNPFLIEEYVMAPPPPPPIIEKEEPPPPPEEKEPPPELEISQPPISLEQLEIILNPGTGSTGLISSDLALPHLRQVNQQNLGSLRIFNISELDQRPIPRRQTVPIFPPNAARKGLNGRVLLEFIITKEGRVQNVRVIQSSDPIFEPYATNAVRQWTFKPGEKDGKKVNTRTQVPIPFNIM
jgi:protein TonB